MKGISVLIGLAVGNLIFAYMSEAQSYTSALEHSYYQVIAITAYVIFPKLSEYRSK